jgi:hypothetical protein
MEKEALKKSGTLTFILARKGHLKGPEMAAVFIKAEKAIFRAIKKHRSPAAFRVYDDGHIEKCRLD